MSNLIIFGSYPPLSAEVEKALGFRDDVSVNEWGTRASAAASEQTGIPS